ncbi:hypothetical protein [uncultured Desulfosarcina sp.]|uniref:hypothetical protein n=1 Tax=uncultured Desulfosarcina sp. TaxID=218289 RepID=UPI0029C93E89|nr:hypothetical protein [uncultured Desulfosarcina sp.]
MIAPRRLNTILPALLTAALLIAGCGIASSYRPAPQKTIRDFSGSGKYLKKVGVVALLNNATLGGQQVPVSYMRAFLESINEEASHAVLVIPGRTEAPPFLMNPPRAANGHLNVFTLSSMARQEGMNFLVSPLLMDVRVRTRDTGFWLFKDVAYSLQVHTAAAIYDTITGTRLALGTLIDEVDIDETEAQRIRNGEDVIVDGLEEVVEEMGQSLGERMAEAINENKWLASVVALSDGACVISAGSEVGIETGDRFAVLDGSEMLTGLDEQRYVVPGVKIGELTITQVTANQSFAVSEAGDPPTVGSILVRD